MIDNGHASTNAASGNAAGNGNAGNAAGNGNAGNAAGNGNAGNAAGNGNAGNAAGNGNAGNTPAALRPGMTLVTWTPPGLARQEDGGLPSGLAGRTADEGGLPPGMQQVIERRSVVLSREQSTFAPQEHPRTALRMQMHRAAARYAAMSISTQFATARNERAITSALSGPSPVQVFLGWLRIK